MKVPISLCEYKSFYWPFSIFVRIHKKLMSYDVAHFKYTIFFRLTCVGPLKRSVVYILYRY